MRVMRGVPSMIASLRCQPVKHWMLMSGTQYPKPQLACIRHDKAFCKEGEACTSASQQAGHMFHCPTPHKAVNTQPALVNLLGTQIEIRESREGSGLILRGPGKALSSPNPPWQTGLQAFRLQLASLGAGKRKTYSERWYV